MLSVEFTREAWSAEMEGKASSASVLTAPCFLPRDEEDGNDS